MNLYREIENCVAARRALVVATVVRDSGSVPRRSGTKMLVFPDGTIHGTIGGGAFEAMVIQDALQVLSRRLPATFPYSFRPDSSQTDDQSTCRENRDSAATRTFGAVCGGRVEVFLEPIMPRERLLIVGGGHCGRALCEAAGLLDWEIIVCDDRADYARPDEFPRAAQVLALQDDFSNLPEIDASTFIVLVGKGFPIDEAALRRVLNSPAPYIGMIGSRRKKQVVFDNLKRDGFSGEQLSRVHAPIGLDIGAQTPAEIAISILAQIIEVRAKIQSAIQSEAETP